MDFEQAQIVSIPGSPYFPNDVVRANALPGWTTYEHFLGSNMIWHNALSAGSAAISIHDNAGSAPVMQGRYRIALQPYFTGTILTGIGQVGTIPLSAQSVRWFQTAGLPLVSFAGQNLSIVHLYNEGAYSVYGANLAGLAGTTGELQFRGQGAYTFGVYLDNITFSTQPVPEPSTYAMITLGLTLALLRRRKQLE